MGPKKLADVAPELVAYIVAGLSDGGRHELIPLVKDLGVFAADVTSGHVSLETIPNLDGGLMMEHAGRDRVSIGKPKGVPSRRWVITMEVIDDRIWHVAVSYPGILRESFRKLARDLARSRR